MTEWMWMMKDGIDVPAQVTRESFRLCHQGQGWVEHIPPAPDPVDSGDVPDADRAEDVQPPADTKESGTDSTTSTRGKRPAAPKE